MTAPPGSAARVEAASRIVASHVRYTLEVEATGDIWQWRATDPATGLVVEGVAAEDSRIRRGLKVIAEQLRRAGI